MMQIVLIILPTIFSLICGQCINYECIFDGVLYSPGDILEFVCFKVMCNSASEWEFMNIISDECDECWISNDPHFYTFDHTYYDWHGRCNYSISQPCCDYCKYDTYDPPYGIYGTFEGCYYSNTVSCLHYTTYKVDQHTALRIFHDGPNYMVSIEINGNAISVPFSAGVPYDCSSLDIYPVILWQDGDCVRIVGREYSIEACPEHMYIFTSRDHYNRICGLCGFYNGEANPGDDFRMRPCGPDATDVNTFAVSWKTDSLYKDCIDLYYGNDQTSAKGKPTPCYEDIYRTQCKDIVYSQIQNCGQPNNENAANIAIENCVRDCCAEPEICEQWMQTAASFICGIGENSKMQNSET